MSYTNKKTLWQKSLSVDEYGDTIRDTGTYIYARKQPHADILKTENGKELLTKSIFYVDPFIDRNALSIKEDDLLDGERVVNIYSMCTLGNEVRMVRFITV